MKRIILTVILSAFCSLVLFGAWGEYVYDIDYDQDMYDAFGDLIGRDMRIAYEYSSIASVNPEDSVGYSLRKARDLFWQRMRGFVAMSEALGWNIVAEFTFQEKGRRIHWSPQMLENNTLDGFYITLKRGGIVGLDILQTFPLDFVHVPVDEFEKTRAEYADFDGYTEMENEDAMVLFQGARLFAFEETFNTVSRGPITYFRVNELEAYALTMNKSSVMLKDQFFKGAYDARNVQEDGLRSFYVKIVCLNQHQTNSLASNYAALYGVSTTNADVKTPVAVVPPQHKAVDKNGNIYYQIRPGEAAVYKIELEEHVTNASAMTNFIVNVTVANSYAIQVAAAENYNGDKIDQDVVLPQYTSSESLSALPFNTVAYAEDPRTDHANYTTEEVRFGVPTANDFLGIHANLTLLTFDITVDFYQNFRFMQYPAEDGEYSRFDATSISGKVARDFGPVRFSVEGYHTDPGYDSRFITYGTNYNAPLHINYGVLDNDDDDMMSPLYNGRGFSQADEKYEGLGSDKNNNNIADYEEDILMIAEDSFFFRVGADDNNNGVSDNYEDDENLDYAYSPNLQGVRGAFTYASDFGLTLKPYGVWERSISQGLTNRMLGAVVDYLYSRRSFGYFNARYEFKVVQDTMPDNVVDHEDELLYQNSWVHSLNAVFSFWAIDNMIFEALPALRYNRQISDDNVILENGVTFRARYKIDFDRWVKGFSIMPMGKFSVYNLRETPLSVIDSEMKTTEVGFVQLNYQKTETFGIKGGYQFRYEQDLKNWKISGSDDEMSHLLVAEMSLSEKSVVMLLGYRWERHIFIDPSVRPYNKSMMYVMLLYRS